MEAGGQLTADEEEVYLQFQESIKDVLNPEHNRCYLLKWLRARKYDVTKASEMYRKSMTWRREMAADTLLQTYEVPEVMRKYYPGGFCGQDKDGCPLLIDPICCGDVRGLLYSVKKSDVIRTMVWRLELMYTEFRRLSQEHGRTIDQCVYLVDMEGFTSRFLWRPALNLYIEILKMLESNYPESLKKTYIINAPQLFKIAYKVLKTFIDKDTVAKFVFLDHHWKERLSQILDVDSLPVFYGGKLTDPDGNVKCETKICYGGPVPIEHYRKKEEFFPAGEVPHKQLLGRGDDFTLIFALPQTGYALRYIFAVDSGSVEFGVCTTRGPPGEPLGQTCRQVTLPNKHFKFPKDGALQPVTKIACHRVPEDGLVLVTEPGFYYLYFENPSHVTRKSLTYFTEILDVHQVSAEGPLQLDNTDV